MCEQLEKRQQEIKGKVEDVAMKVRRCEELTRDERILWTNADTKKKVEELKGKIKKIETITEKIERLRKDQVPSVPTSKEVEELGQNLVRIEALKESLAARGLAVTVTPGKKGSLEVEVDGERLKPGSLTMMGTESVRVEAPDLWKVAVKANLQRARDAKIDIKRLEESIRTVLDKYSVNSTDELKELNRNQRDISEKIRVLEAERSGVDERPGKEMILELNKLEEKYEQYKKIKRTPEAIKFNSVGVDLEKLINRREREEEEARTVLDEARAERDKVDKELLEKREELAGTRAEQKRFSEELDNARNREREIIRQYGLT